MSDQEEPERRRYDSEILDAVNGVNERLLNTERGINRQLEQFRRKQETQMALVLTLQDHKTIERVDVMWETLESWRKLAETAKAVGARLARFTAWGCGTLLALGTLFIAAYAVRLIHFG